MLWIISLFLFLQFFQVHQQRNLHVISNTIPSNSPLKLIQQHGSKAHVVSFLIWLKKDAYLPNTVENYMMQTAQSNTKAGTAETFWPRELL